MRTLEKFVENSQLVHQLKRRGMNRVAAKVTEKVLVLFKHKHINSSASEEHAEHHPRIREPHGQHDGARRTQRADRVRDRGRDVSRVDLGGIDAGRHVRVHVGNMQRGDVDGGRRELLAGGVRHRAHAG